MNEIKNITLQEIQPVKLVQSDIGSQINENFKNINDNFVNLVGAEYLKGTKGDSITTNTIILRADKSEEDIDGIGYELYNKFISLIFGDDEVDKNRVTNIDKSKVIIAWDESNSKQISSFPYIFKDPVTPGENPANYKDYSCVIYFDNNKGEYVKEDSLPTLYYDNDKKDFCWKVNGIETQIIAMGPMGIGTPGTGILLAKGTKKNNIYEITHFLHSFNGSNNISLDDWLRVDDEKNKEKLKELSIQNNSLVFAHIVETTNQEKSISETSETSTPKEKWEWGLLKLDSEDQYKFLFGGNLSNFFAIGGATLGELMEDNNVLYVLNGSSDNGGHQLKSENGSLVMGYTDAYNKEFKDKEGEFISKYKKNNFIGDINVEGEINGNVKGNSTSATKLETPRQISLSGGAHSSNVGFDGSSDITIKVDSLNEQNLKWDNPRTPNKEYTPNYTPVDVALGDHTNANRFSFMNPDLITVQYTNDGGETWANYWEVSEEVTQEMINKYKQSLVTTGLSCNIHPGKKLDGQTSADKVKVTIKTPVYGGSNDKITIYSLLKKLLIRVSAADGNHSTVELKTIFKADPKTNRTPSPLITTHKLQGYPGWNAIPFDYNFGGYLQSPSSHVVEIVLTFNGNVNCSGMQINNIAAHGDYLYINNSGCDLAETGHLYTWDPDKNVTFPSDITATKYITAGGTNQQVVLGDGSLKNLSEIGGSGDSDGDITDGGSLEELTVQNLYVNSIDGINGNTLNKLDVLQLNTGKLNTGNISNSGSINTNYIDVDRDISSYNTSSFNMVIGNELCLNNYYNNTDGQVDHSYLTIYPPKDNIVNSTMFEWHYSSEGSTGASVSKTVTVTYKDFFEKILGPLPF